jgi:hypothetical protein
MQPDIIPVYQGDGMIAGSFDDEAAAKEHASRQ